MDVRDSMVRFGQLEMRFGVVRPIVQQLLIGMQRGVQFVALGRVAGGKPRDPVFHYDQQLVGSGAELFERLLGADLVPLRRLEIALGAAPLPKDGDRSDCQR